jgi:hypothetical protein
VRKILLSLAIFLLILPVVAAADVAYILEDSSTTSAKIISSLNNKGISFELVRDSQIISTDFSQFSALLVSEDVTKRDNLPLGEMNSIFLDQRIAEETWPGSIATKTSNARSIHILAPDHEILTGLPIGVIDIYPGVGAATHYLSIKPFFIETLATRGSGTIHPVLAASIREVDDVAIKEVFFGAIASESWNSNAVTIFENSLDWVLSDVDQDQDGFLFEDDCDDSDPDVNPNATEIPYNGKDDDCNPDTIDDDFDSDGFGIAQDCDESDPLINPNAQEILDDIDQNCQNDAPFLTIDLPDVTWDEDSPAPNAIDLNNHFADYEGDPLNFDIHSTSDNINIQLEIDNGVVSFTSTKDYFGSDWVVFKAEDADSFATSNQVTLTVLPMDEPPEFTLPLTCLTEINEDTQHSCTLQATDFELEPFTFSVGTQSNLICEVLGDTLSYISSPDYNGAANCELIVSGDDGSSSHIFNVNILPINDAPKISSFSPATTLVKVPEGIDKEFSINVLDPDSTPTFSWILGSSTLSTTTSKYSFKNSIGNYFLEAKASDTEFSSSVFWNIIVSPISEFTCSEVSGSICSSNQRCNSETLGVKDTNSCCATSCIPRFKDADECKLISPHLKIEITNPESKDKFKLGDSVRTSFKIENNLDEDQDIDVEVHIYNIDSQDSLDEGFTTLDINSNSLKSASLTLKIPEDTDLDDKLAVFIKAEDSVCTQEYLELDIERLEHSVAIESLTMPKVAGCGDLIEARVKVENLGTEDETVSLSLKNSELKINLETDSFKLEEFDQDDKKTESFSIIIPQDTKPGEYTVTASARYNGARSTSLSETIKVTCFQEDFQESSPSIAETLTLSSIAPASILKKATSSSTSTLIAMLMLTTTIIIAALAGLLYFYKFKKN